MKRIILRLKLASLKFWKLLNFLNWEQSHIEWEEGQDMYDRDIAKLKENLQNEKR